MLIIQNLTYIHPNKDLLLNSINLIVNPNDKIALVGNNGSGKTTLLKIITGQLHASGGTFKTNDPPYYIPQIFGQYDHITIAEALGVEGKLQGLRGILNGDASEENYTLLDDDWSIEERCEEALQYWQLRNIDLFSKMGTLSGGQKTKVFLAGIAIHQPELVLLDEPTNHLDLTARKLFYDFVKTTNRTLLIVSHDRTLLNLVDTVCELSSFGITSYGGNYDFYTEQKQIETNALTQGIQSKEKALKKAKEKERETLERQQKLDARGKRKQEKSGVSRIMMNTLRNSAENSTSKMKDVHAEKIGGISKELHELRSSLTENDRMKFGFDHSGLHKGKILFTAKDINVSYQGTRFLWKKNLDFQITSGERISLKGDNGSGKTTLIHVILGNWIPQIGSVTKMYDAPVYIDQDYSLIDGSLNVYEQAQRFNSSALQEHEVKIRLNRFLFSKEDWDKPCSVLSGGERMRLSLCCLTIGNKAPDIIVLDEPTNNLDIQNTEILTQAINEYRGTLIVVSHDASFLEHIHVERELVL